LGVFVAALAGAVVTGVVWLMWWYVAGPFDIDRLLGTPRLGIIPDNNTSPAPTLTDTSSNSSRAYRQLLSEIEGRTNGHVLLVSSPAPGQGASTVALNLAVAGTQRGRRIALIDGDIDGNGVSRFLSTGSEPGLTDLAEGAATLADASRLWTIGEDSALPVVPSGSSTKPSEAALAGPGLAGSIEQIAGRADAVLIDAPPIAWDGATTPLAAHADGTILVVTEGATDTSVADARDRLASAGAPVIGYVANRSAPPSFWRIPVVR
ncbi:MAG: CpsD/CapB family tyrosine-protein kinase, partial [Phycisphaeraceae bacterium]|nr:CpsD/CapB family tyrosine-protein kinase [Phycisphaeraceae bacterium]